MVTNKDEYKFFLEDDMDYEDYSENMRDDAVWAGQMEMNILSQLYRFNVIVHQVGNPSMAQGFFPWDEVPCLHISFHLDCHYNSVRREDDPCNGRPAAAYSIGHKLKKLDESEDSDEEEKKEQVANAELRMAVNEIDEAFPSRNELV